MRTPGRKPTGRIRKPINLTLPEPLKNKLVKVAFKQGVSVSEWLEAVALRELGMEAAIPKSLPLPPRVLEEAKSRRSSVSRK
jgi:hypothetical protein